MGSMTYLRHKVGEPRLTPRAMFEPLDYHNPLVGSPCGECGLALRAGQRPTLLAVGPDDLTTAAEADAGHWYRALTVPLHESCAYPEPQPSEPPRREAYSDGSA
jgi:hypothetical protein